MLIFILKAGLTHIDLIFPILAGIKRQNPSIRIKIIFPSKLSFTTIKNNKALYKSLNDIAEIKNFYFSKEIKMPYIPYIFLAIFSIIHRNYILKNLLFKRAYIFTITSVPKISWLINFNRYLFKGKKISLFLHSFDFNHFLAELKRVFQVTGTTNQLFINQLDTDSDALITSFNYDQLQSIYPNIVSHSYSINYIGTEMFTWPTWQKIIIDNSKSEIKNLPKKFIFFPLAVLIRKDKISTRDFRGSIIKIINCIREKDQNIDIVFRPHPTTDIKELNIFLTENNVKNYIISYANPIIIIHYCSFVVRYGSSLLDSRVMDSGKYLIRYYYDELAEDMKEELKYNHKLFKQFNFIDIKDEKILKKVIHETLDKNKYKEPYKNKSYNENYAIKNILKIIGNKN